LLPAVGTGAISGADLFFRACSNETAINLLPDWRGMRAVTMLALGAAPASFDWGRPPRQHVA